MNIVYSGDLDDKIAERLRIPKQTVHLVLYNYYHYLREKVNGNESIKELNICYLNNVNEPKDVERETMGYISSEISNFSNIGNVTILSILNTLEDVILEELLNGVGVSIRGLIRIKYDKNTKKLTIRKSTSFNGKPVKAYILYSFKRKVELRDAG